MDITLLLKGLLLGLSIAAPVGPIGILCIRRTLAEGRIAGLVCGLGAATADGFYGFVAAFGLTFVSNFLVSQRFWIGLIGGIFLLYLGVKTLLAKPATQAAKLQTRSSSRWAAYGSTVFLTLTNPTTILSFVAIFAGFGVGNGDYLGATIIVFGVFLGSAAWWLVLSGGVNLLRSRFNQNWLLWVNRLSGVLIIAFGVVSLVSLFFTK